VALMPPEASRVFLCAHRGDNVAAPNLCEAVRSRRDDLRATWNRVNGAKATRLLRGSENGAMREERTLVAYAANSRVLHRAS